MNQDLCLSNTSNLKPTSSRNQQDRDPEVGEAVANPAIEEDE